MTALAADDIPSLMRQWAEWFPIQAAAGYADSTTIWRAMLGNNGGGEFKSAPPAGLGKLELHGALRRLVDSMGVLDGDADARPHVFCLQATYLVGPEQAMGLTGKSRTKLYEACRTAEALLLVEMKRH